MRETVDLYDLIAPDYQRWWALVIEPAAVRLLDLVGPVVAERPGALIVDVGAGTGTVVRAAVARWPDVRTIAVDPSDGMAAVGRAVAARTLPASARRRLGWVSGVAERLPMADGSADVVVSAFTLQYLRNRSAALREAQRILRPGGSIAVVTWLADGGVFEPDRLFDDLIRELDVERPAALETGPFRSLPSAAALVRRAGFRAVHASEGVVEWQWRLDAYVRCVMACEQRDLVETLDPATRLRLRRLLRDRLGQLAGDDFHYRQPVAYVVGRRAAT